MRSWTRSYRLICTLTVAAVTALATGPGWAAFEPVASAVSGTPNSGIGYPVCVLADGSACDATTSTGPDPTPAPAIDPTTFGRLTWSFARPAPADKAAEITHAMDTAINNLNTVANYWGNVSVVYNPGVPTAQASFEGWVEFGGSISPGVAQHEMGHWLGSGTHWAYASRLNSTHWTGTTGTGRLQEWDGTGAELSSNNVHFWPYGWNYPNEYFAPQREIGIVGAQRSDIGLYDGTAAAQGSFRLQNRTNGLFVDVERTAPAQSVTQAVNANSVGQIWQISRSTSGGFITITSPATQTAIDGDGLRSNGSPVSARAVAVDVEQHWEIVPTDGGWFQLRNRASDRCLDNGAQTANGATLQLWPCGPWIPNQQWRLVRDATSTR